MKGRPSHLILGLGGVRKYRPGSLVASTVPGTRRLSINKYVNGQDRAIFNPTELEFNPGLALVSCANFNKDPHFGGLQLPLP